MKISIKTDQWNDQTAAINSAEKINTLYAFLAMMTLAVAILTPNYLRQTTIGISILMLLASSLVHKSIINYNKNKVNTIEMETNKK